MIKTMFFDLGNVLVFFSHEKMCGQISACSGLTPETVKQILFKERLQEAYETGNIDSAGVYQVFQARSSHSFTLQDLMEAASDIFIPNTPLWPLVEHLKQMGLRLILLSNTSECHFNYVYAHYPVLRLFDDKILSYEVGAMKPDSRIFQKALSRSSCHPEECFYTDDIPEYIAGAKKAGLDAELFVGVPALKQALAARGVSVSC